jgi:hypothetical protein
MKKRWTAVLLLSLGSAWAEEPFYLSVKDNTLSARITQIPLGEVLQALAREARVAVYVRGSAEAISASFDELPLEEGVKRLLTGRDYTLAFERPAPAGRSPRLIEIRILAEGGAGALTTISEATPAPETIPTSVKPPASQSLDALARGSAGSGTSGAHRRPESPGRTRGYRGAGRCGGHLGVEGRGSAGARHCARLGAGARLSRGGRDLARDSR